jgi:hypothetical protein
MAVRTSAQQRAAEGCIFEYCSDKDLEFKEEQTIRHKAIHTTWMFCLQRKKLLFPAMLI